ncbi:MAG: division/cell wall cluster transcriptional repressor MraZ [Legionellales bacterium]|nr:division/cell wall cluster transcriptional repressor MraZ [Legionellales bacterium]
MYRGINTINLDAKGRLTIPTRYRERLQETCSGVIVATIDTEAPCLLLYPLPEWEAIEAKISALSSFNKSTRRIQRLLIGHATELESDGTGRVLIPPPLRQYANLDKHVVLVGQGKKFELWDETQWNDSRDQWLRDGSDMNGEDIPDDLKNLSL